jgi:hypothetical protein
MAASLAKDVCLLVICLLNIKTPNEEDYLWHGKFPNKLCKKFEVILLSRIKERFKNVPSKLLKFKVMVYISETFLMMIVLLIV